MKGRGTRLTYLLIIITILAAAANAADPIPGQRHVFKTNETEAKQIIVADAYVSYGYKNKNYGYNSHLFTCSEENYFLKFDLSKGGVQGEILDAKLQMTWDENYLKKYIGFYLYSTNNEWQENTITYNNAPPALKKISNYLQAGNININLKEFFKTNPGVSSIRTVNHYCSAGSSGAWYSRHTNKPPKLWVTYRIPNTAPLIAGIDASVNVSVGNNITFKAYWIDMQEDNATLYVCKENKKCTNNETEQWCKANASKSPAECQYTATPEDNETNHYYAFVCDDYDGSCSAPKTGVFKVIHGPYVNNVTITPTPTYRTSVLTGIGEYGHVNATPEGNSVLMWQVNNAAAGNGTTLARNFSIGDNITFYYKPCDENGVCGTTKQATTTIQNAKPQITKIETIGECCYKTKDLVLEITASDEDEDILNTTWQWWLNGTLTPENTSTFPANYNYTIGDNITYKVTVTDGFDTTHATGNIIIQNHAPEFTMHSITSPLTPGANVTCKWIINDIEESNFTTLQKWYKNNALIMEWNGTTQNNTEYIIEAPGGVYGDNYTCIVTATDGINYVETTKTTIVTSKCGNRIKEGNEECDGENSCTSQCTILRQTSGSSPTKNSASTNTRNNAKITTTPTPTPTPNEELVILPPIKEETKTPETKTVPKQQAETKQQAEAKQNPVATNTPKPETADVTGFLPLASHAWLGIAVLALAIIIYTQKQAITAHLPESKPIKRVQKPLPNLPTKFPASQKKREEIVKQIAKKIQAREGKFHAAGIWHELHKQYGDSVIRDRIYIEKNIGQWLKENAEYVDSYRTAKYYKFKDT